MKSPGKHSQKGKRTGQPHHRKNFDLQEGKSRFEQEELIPFRTSTRKVTLCGIDRPTSLFFIALGRDQNNLYK